MLKDRIITAIIAGLILLLVLFAVPQIAARVVILLLLLLAAWEWSGFLKANNVVRYAYLLAVAAVIVPAFFLADSLDSRVLVFQVALVWWLLALLWTWFYPTPVPSIVTWLCGLLVIVPAYVALDWLFLQGPWLLLFMLGIVLAADIGAYFSGKAFGKVKLASQISPGKTWEGAIGGLVTVALVVAVESYFLGFSYITIIPLCLAVAIGSIIGDLTVSIFKRQAGLKDSGTLFPGHGGFLDRADSIAAAAPLFALGLSWFGPGVLRLPQ